MVLKLYCSKWRSSNLSGNDASRGDGEGQPVMVPMIEVMVCIRKGVGGNRWMYSLIFLIVIRQ